jgi:hypothetical protein
MGEERFKLAQAIRLQLLRPGLYLLQTEHIRSVADDPTQDVFSQGSPQSVDVPGDNFHNDGSLPD